MVMTFLGRRFTPGDWNWNANRVRKSDESEAPLDPAKETFGVFGKEPHGAGGHIEEMGRAVGAVGYARADRRAAFDHDDARALGRAPQKVDGNEDTADAAADDG